MKSDTDVNMKQINIVVDRAYLATNANNIHNNYIPIFFFIASVRPLLSGFVGAQFGLLLYPHPLKRDANPCIHSRKMLIIVVAASSLKLY